MFCIYCGESIDNDSVFCAYCGKSLTPVKTGAALEKPPEITGGTVQGAEQGAVQMPITKDEQSAAPSFDGAPAKKSGVPKAALFAVIAVAAVCILIFGVIKPFDKDKQDDFVPAVTPPSETETDAAIPPSAEITIAERIENIGDRIRFGAWNDSPVMWRVLDIQDGQALVISENVLLARQLLYHGEFADITWSDSDLCAWLNGEFLNAAFTADEQSAITTAYISTPDNAESGAPGGADTEDKLFLLSAGEAEQYFSGAGDRAAIDADGAAAGWWLRSPGFDSNFAAYVREDGSLSDANVYRIGMGARPALWLNLNGAAQTEPPAPANAESAEAPPEPETPQDALYPFAGTVFVTNEPKLGIFVRSSPEVTGESKKLNDGNKIAWIKGGDTSVELVATGNEYDTGVGYWWYEVQIPQWYRDTQKQTENYAGKPLIGWVRGDIVRER